MVDREKNGGIGGFNPCFYWMSEGTGGGIVKGEEGTDGFNPCFYWMSEGTVIACPSNGRI